jgi:hypothetical protein
MMSVRVLRRFLQAWNQTAIEFPNQGAMQKYLDAHPKAKKQNHWIKDQKPHTPTIQPKQPYSKPKPEGNKPEAPKNEAPADIDLGINPDLVNALAQVVTGPEDPVSQMIKTWFSNEKVSAASVREAMERLQKFVQEGKHTFKEETELKAAVSKLKKFLGDQDPPKETKSGPTPTFTPNGSHPLQQKLKIVKRKRIGEGILGAEFVDVKGDDGKTHKAVWKKGGEAEIEVEDSEGKTRHYIDAGTFYEREEISSEFDDIFGGKRIVPKAYRQEIDGQVGSIHERVKGAKNTSEAVYDISNSGQGDQGIRKLASSFESKKMFFMDLITGNDDRHVNNALWTKDKTYEYVPSAIDNGLTWPDGPTCRFMFAIERTPYAEEVMMPNEEIRKCLKELDIKAMGKMLNGYKCLTGYAKVQALARCQALKNNPELIVKAISAANQDYIDDYEDTIHQWVKLDTLSRLQSGEITQEQLKEIEELVGDKEAV